MSKDKFDKFLDDLNQEEAKRKKDNPEPEEPKNKITPHNIGPTTPVEGSDFLAIPPEEQVEETPEKVTDDPELADFFNDGFVGDKGKEFAKMLEDNPDFKKAFIEATEEREGKIKKSINPEGHDVSISGMFGHMNNAPEIFKTSGKLDDLDEDSIRDLVEEMLDHYGIDLADIDEDAKDKAIETLTDLVEKLKDKIDELGEDAKDARLMATVDESGQVEIIDVRDDPERAKEIARRSLGGLSGGLHPGFILADDDTDRMTIAAELGPEDIYGTTISDVINAPVATSAIQAVVGVIKAHGIMDAQEISEKLGLDLGNVEDLLEEAVDRHFLHEDEDEEDKYYVCPAIPAQMLNPIVDATKELVLLFNRIKRGEWTKTDMFCLGLEENRGDSKDEEKREMHRAIDWFSDNGWISDEGNYTERFQEVQSLGYRRFREARGAYNNFLLGDRETLREGREIAMDLMVGEEEEL